MQNAATSLARECTCGLCDSRFMQYIASALPTYMPGEDFRFEFTGGRMGSTRAPEKRYARDDERREVDRGFAR